jgi:hypothetical protein
MLLNFIDDMFLRGSVPYDDVGSLREDFEGFGVIRCRSGEVIHTKLEYESLVVAYRDAVLNDMEMMMDIDDGDGDEDDELYS